MQSVAGWSRRASSALWWKRWVPLGRWLSAMPDSIRSRLLLLVMSWALPAMAAGTVIVYLTAQAERTADERALREMTRAMAQVVNREIDQRALIGRLLAQQVRPSQLRSAEDQSEFFEQARGAMRGLGGWVELRLDGQLVVSTRHPPAVLHDGVPEPEPVAATTRVTALQRAADGTLYSAVLTPVVSGERVVGSVAVTVLASEFQRVVDESRIPRAWVVAIIDRNHRLAARVPAGLPAAGQLVPEADRQQLRTQRDGPIESTTAEGTALTGYFHTLPDGWTFTTAMPRPQFGGYLARTVVQVTLGGLLLLGLAIAAAMWVSRGIAGAVLRLERAALRLQNGERVGPQNTGIIECNTVAAAMTRASEHVLEAREDLERRVSDAVQRTREAEQTVARSQRIEALGRLTGGVAHDFNNLLGIVSNSARLTQRHIEALPALQMPVNATLRAVDAGQRLTQHLLRFAGRRPVRPQPVQLDQFLRELSELLRSVIGQRIELVVEVAPDTSPVTVDASELELALMNLAINARDAMPEGGTLTLTAHNASNVDVTSLPAGRYVVIAVADTGAGMDESLAQRVFEPFFTTKAAGHGTGLGLSQVHGFCQQAGGTARLTSAPDQGTRVALLLPATPTAQGAPAPDSGRAAFSPTHANVAGLRVLLVEDNRTLAEVTQALLSASGCAVHGARSSREALEQLAATPDGFDVVLSDVVMPGTLDGLGLARELRQLRPGLPIVLMSGYSSALSTVREFTVLRKPVAEDTLLRALHEAVTGTTVP
jgi:signal transduction histidine kinase